MRFCRYNDNRLGVVRGDQVHDVTDVMNDLPSYRYPAPLGDALISNLDTLRPKMEALADKVAGIPIDGLDLLSPVANPTKIMGTPQNYKKACGRNLRRCQHPPRQTKAQSRRPRSFLES
jgi:hypothetical protein